MSDKTISNKKRRQLKSILIYPQFQFKFIFWMMTMCFLNILIFAAFSVLWVAKMQSHGVDLQLPTSHPYFVLLNDFSNSYVLVLVGALLLSSIVCVLVGLGLSHRIAGPLVKMRNHLLDISHSASADPLKEVHFRASDFFQDLADSYNKQLHKKNSKDDGQIG